MLTSGCSTLAYHAQAVHGHLELMDRRVPIDTLLAEEGRHGEPQRPGQQERLRRLQDMRAFASRELHLPDNRGYTLIARVGREAVAWNVFAAETFRVEPKTWCFPVAGCVPYRGYFAREAAEAFAAELRAEGLETFVAPVAAYSTLGWFDDPLPDYVLDWPEWRRAGLMYHELAHQVVYRPGDATFNESYARAVEIEGVRRWLEWRGDPSLRAGYERALERSAWLGARLAATRQALAKLYSTAPAADAGHAEKQRLIEDLREDCARRLQIDPGHRELASWVAGTINNARLAAAATYFDRVEEFRALLAETGGDWARFHARVRAMAGSGADLKK